MHAEGTVQNASTPLNEHKDHILACTSVLTCILYSEEDAAAWVIQA